MMTQIQKAMAALKRAHDHLNAAGAAPYLIEHLEALMAMLKDGAE